MWNTKSIGTPLFARAVRGSAKLSSPFAKNFDEEQWVSALKDSEVNERDLHLAMNAIFVGRQVAGLRDSYIKTLFEGISKRSAIILAVASANRHYFKLVTDHNDQIRDIDRESIHLSELGQIPVAGLPQSNMSPDDIMPVFIDTLPHWFYEAKGLEEAREALSTDFGQLELRASVVLSIESGLRDLWNTALWEDHRQKKSPGNLTFGPHDKPSAFYWHACHQRTMAAMIGPEAIFLDLPLIEGEVDDILSVTRLKNTKGNLRFAVGKATKRSRKRLSSNLTSLENSYLSDFLDEPIQLKDQQISLRILLHALWVLSDMSSLLHGQIKPRMIRKYADAKAFSLLVQKKEVVRVIQSTLNVKHEMAVAIVYQLSIKPDDTGKCFAEGLWIHPLVELSENELLLVAPSIVAGSRIRFGEKTLLELNARNQVAYHEQGLRFEARVRSQTIEAIKNNNLLNECVCLPSALPRKGDDDEEIDLILRIGRTIVVGEVKCFVAPTESMERYNYITHLEHAAEQAVRKMNWLKDNFESVAEALSVQRPSSDLNFLPMVILNQRMGSGLKVGGAIVTDSILWNLYFTDHRYNSGAAITKSKKVLTYTTFYNSQHEAEASLEMTFLRPPPLVPFLEGEEWSTTEFPISSGRLLLEIPSIASGALETDSLKDASAFLIKARD